ncbi:hypothetical protein EV586_10470 [Tumebacillus sp. BK434]|uniref:hypothetical protein n=1 Tax=Tumebacillus sp. BK434 TaxID=2512169 RepID=UPI0010464F2E|nr:hypothetical protein [Tumebacillus sp. BK434]TCP54452.1 hypothetical protein EV586_10470 [Tumebacillus sp. BK434]
MKNNLILLVAGIVLFLLNESLLKPATDNAFIHGHLNDVLIIWVFIPFLNVLLSLYPKRNLRFETLISCFILTLLVGITWEYLIPLFTSNGTSDPVDMLMYIIGGVTFWGMLKMMNDA